MRFTPSFATTPGKRFTMSFSSIAGAVVATFDWSRSAVFIVRCLADGDPVATKPARQEPDGFRSSVSLMDQLVDVMSTITTQGAVGTVMSPVMICSLYASSSSVMSSTNPPVVE